MSGKTEQKKTRRLAGHFLISPALQVRDEKEVAENRPVRPQDEAGHLGEGEPPVRAGGLEPDDGIVRLTTTEMDGENRLVERLELRVSPDNKAVFTGEGGAEGEGVFVHFFGLVGCVIATPTMGTNRIPSMPRFTFFKVL